MATLRRMYVRAGRRGRLQGGNLRQPRGERLDDGGVEGRQVQAVRPDRVSLAEGARPVELENLPGVLEVPVDVPMDAVAVVGHLLPRPLDERLVRRGVERLEVP